MNRHVNIQIGPKGGLISTASYLAFGILIYMWLGTYAVFSWVDPWLYMYMAFWPFILIWNVFIWAVLIVIVIIVIAIFASWWDSR